ncbi:lipid A phosphoethanolamine transferase [Flavobacterium sp. ANB]|uniref:lipid A phosphoethanolamine transferase n=1 Tax=unclassified Flavobacterium TaxID=196869 RepID=UPI0012B88591|nr:MULTISPECIES: lipid A phosphoethanolamine transferase [unclassified Flavobacterium]MBF4519092.1 lipid A phosphoethanolamine transferase [Flavobacterium sp. ANB]MTD71708.1 lipid A phosphoethanolamine transferase [Flavobacterium sp. LC2016-13]
MKKLQRFYLVYFLSIFSINAQDSISKAKNPYTEARYHYYLKTILLFNEYLDTDSGSFNTTQLRFLHPIANKAWNLRVDLPLVSTNTSSINKTGIGDIGAGISYIPYLEHSKGIAFRVKIVSNSAVDPALGTGKWVVAPAIFYGSYFYKKKMLWIASLENQLSFAGSDNRSDVNTTALENYLMFILGKNWFAADVAFRYNATNKGYPNNAFIEFGRKITQNDMAYIHPSIGFGNHKSYNYGIEVGMLILF